MNKVHRSQCIIWNSPKNVSLLFQYKKFRQKYLSIYRLLLIIIIYALHDTHQFETRATFESTSTRIDLCIFDWIYKDWSLFQLIAKTFGLSSSIQDASMQTVQKQFQIQKKFVKHNANALGRFGYSIKVHGHRTMSRRWKIFDLALIRQRISDLAKHPV